MKVAEHVVEKLVDEGVEVLFTVPGEQMDALFGALSRTGIRVVQTRHEQGAAFMAFGYARSTGNVGVFNVISGPGVLNALSGLATGYAGDARMLCIAGQIGTSLLGRGYGVPHEIPDQLAMLRGVTGWSGRISQPRQVTEVMGEAFHRLRFTRPRPVAVEIPADVLGAEVDSPVAWDPAPVEWAPVQAMVEAAVDVLARARRPLIFVGSGARAAADQIGRLARLLKAPVASDMGGRGIVSDRDELAISLTTAHRLWPEVDVVLAVGTRFMRPQVEWGWDDNLSVVRIDIDVDEINRVTAPAVAVVADAGLAVAALLRRMSAVDGREPWLARVKEAQREVGERVEGLTPQIGFIRAMRAALPDDGFFVDELTQVGYVSRMFFPVYQPGTFIPTTYQGALGCGLATALGVKVANPDRPVLSISGDGGFLYAASELATAVLHRINIVAVVFNDGGYGNVSRSQLAHNGFTVATELHNPDFVEFAQSFGAQGLRVHTPEELSAAVAGALRSEGPTVIEVPVGRMPSPWPLIRLPKVR